MAVVVLGLRFWIGAWTEIEGALHRIGWLTLVIGAGGAGLAMGFATACAVGGRTALARALLDAFDDEIDNFVRVLPRDYAAVLQTRQDAAAEGLDPDSDIVWTRILEVTGG